MACWIGVVSRAHVEIGVRGGFMQLNHGKAAPLRRLRAGDRIAMYSPRTAYPDGDMLQAFTAIGTVRTGEVYQVTMAPGFEPFRVDVDFHPCRPAPIRPLIDRLSFIRDKQHWGAVFRFGALAVPEDDLALIAEAMRVDDRLARVPRAHDNEVARSVPWAGGSAAAGGPSMPSDRAAAGRRGSGA